MTRPFAFIKKNGNFAGVTILALLAAAAFGSLMARPAAADDYSHVRIIRLSFVEGQVQFQRLNDGWQNAGQNLPVEEGVQVKTAAGFAEVEFEAGLYLRMAQNTALAFTELGLQDGKRITKMELLSGTAIVTAKDVGHDQISVVAGNLMLKVDHNGDYRVDMAPKGAWVTALRGKVDVLAGSREVTLSNNHTLHEADGNLDSIEVVQSAALDSFDKWVSQRGETTEEYTDATTSYIHNGGNYGIGFADLYNYGLWYNCPGFGMCWQPYGVGNGWIPFANGQWDCLNGFGWTWVSAEPWGWLPYHFGGWFDAPGQGWVWVPGSGRTWTNWQTATAGWVNMQNNLVAWTPNLAVPTNPSKVSNQASLRQSEVILAAQATGNTIRPMARLPISQTQATSIRAGVAPALSFGAGAQAAGSVAASVQPTSGGGGGVAQSQVMSAPINRVSEKSLAPAAGSPNSGRFMEGPRGSASNAMRAAPAGAPATAAPRAASMSPMMPAEMRAARSEGEFSRGASGGTSSANRVQGGGGNSSSGLSRASGSGSSGGGLSRASGNGSSGGGGGFSRSSGGGGGSFGGGSSSSAGSSHAGSAAPSSSGGGSGGSSGGVKH